MKSSQLLAIEVGLAVLAAGLLAAILVVTDEAAYLALALATGAFVGTLAMALTSWARGHVRALRRHPVVYLSYDSTNRQRAERLRKAFAQAVQAHVVVEELANPRLGRAMLSASKGTGSSSMQQESVPCDTPGADLDRLGQADAFVLLLDVESSALSDAVTFARDHGVHVVRVAAKNAQSGDELGVDTVMWPRNQRSKDHVRQVVQASIGDLQRSHRPRRRSAV